jgi:hypothetical protein
VTGGLCESQSSLPADLQDDSHDGISDSLPKHCLPAPRPEFDSRKLPAPKSTTPELWAEDGQDESRGIRTR